MRFLLLASAAILAISLDFHGAAAVELGTYRALYAFQPSRVEQGAVSQPIDGEIAYEVRGSDCAGYTVDSNFLNRFIDGDSGTRVIDLKSTSFESSDGLQLQVSQSQTVNKQLADQENITVKRTAPGTDAQGNLTGSKKDSFTVKGEMLFPTAHQKKLLAEAAAGVKRDVSLVYDGSDGKKQFRIITFIGNKREPGTYPKDLANPEAAKLQTMASWPFQLGYYPVDNPNAEEPEFQATFNMYENGVTTEMLFDYGNYAMKGQLTKLDLVPPEPCPQPTAQ